MKTIFVINPKAGKKNNIDNLSKIILKTAEKLGADVEIYTTKCEGDATCFVKDYLENNGPARFVACGGDGTLCEVLNGAIECEGAEVGVMPIGTGNDFVKNFEADFSDIEAQILSDSELCDAIKYKTTLPDGTKRDGYCANMINIGFDCNAGYAMSEMKKKPFVSGSMAYLLAVFTTLVKKKGADLEMLLDGNSVYNGRLLLTSIANGCFCGGGVKSNPLACVHDGLMNVNIVKNISRTRFLTLFPFYKKGTHGNVRGIEKYITNTGCRKITIKPNGDSMRICVDGEVFSAGVTELEILHDAYKFVVPKKA